jgi:hypothetical protein
MHASLSIHSLNAQQDERMVQQSPALVSIVDLSDLVDGCR